MRLARHVYWAPNPDDIAHGALQKWFYTVDPGVDGFGEERARRQSILQTPDAPIAPTQTERAPAAWTEALQDYVVRGACEKVGVAEMDPAWVFEGHHIPQSRVIVAGVQHDYGTISAAPAPEAGLEVVRQYNRAALVAKDIANWLRGEGWNAEPVTGPMSGALALIPPALACGFGELGKHGSVIDRELGASFRLSAVLTDAPFQPTPAAAHGIDAFCAQCRVCEDACPPEALFSEKKTVRGVEKWYVDFDKCLPFFNETQGCAICIAVCPWSRPGVGVNLAAKLARRSDRRSSGG